MHSPQIYRQRRNTFQKQMEADGIALFFNGIRSNHDQHRFRPNSDFYFLTGFAEEEAVLALTADEAHLYLPDRDPKRELWDGSRLGVAKAIKSLGVDRATDIRKFESELADLLKNKTHLYHAFGQNTDRDRLLLGRASATLENKRSRDFGPANIVHPSTILHEQRLVKSPEEIEALRESCLITREGHLAVMRRLKPGLFEYELEACIAHEFIRHGATEAYPSIVASGANACVLHYITNNARLGPSDLLLVDAGAEKHCMTSDVTRTYPVGGRFTPAQKDVYEAVLAAQKNAIHRTVPGSSMHAVNESTSRDLALALRTLKILGNASVDEIIEKGSHKKYYPHNTGHWLGMDVHDVGDYYGRDAPRPFQNGMVCTVEPGLYFPADDQTLPTEFRGLGVRIEDDILVSGDSPTNLTADIPKEIDQIETLCRENKE